jgi:hypothetical protein
MSGVDTPMDPRSVRVGGLTCAEAAGALGASVEPVPPPLELRDRLMSALAATPQVPDPVVDATDAPPTGVVVPFERPSRSPRPSRIVWIGLAAAAVIALLLGGWNLSLQRQISDSGQQLALVRQALLAASDPTSRVATLTGTDAAPGASGIAVIPASGTGYLVLRDLPALPAGEVYQAWYLAGGVPTSAGLMDPSASGLTVMAGVEPVAGTDTIALTVEPAGGVPQPTGAVVVAGTLPA